MTIRFFFDKPVTIDWLCSCHGLGEVARLEHIYELPSPRRTIRARLKAFLSSSAVPTSA